MSAYYNEVDAYAAQWLRNLIAAGHIAPGEVDGRSIVDVRADDVRGYTQCHFFAGIGGWSIALRLAGWPDDRPVWSGSCPCQPFSAAGAGKAADDSRHLWPAWFPLIAECRPARIFGEQVEAAIGWGWLDVVFADLEQEGYACGAAVLPACSVGAPHIRQRLWFVADATGVRREQRREGETPSIQGQCAERETPYARSDQDGLLSGRPERLCSVGLVADADPPGRSLKRRGWLLDGERPAFRDDADGRGGMGDAVRPRLQEQRGLGSIPSGESTTNAREASERASASAFWSDCIWLPCTDGKARPAQPGIQPLAHGVPARVAKLRAAGNAIVPQVAAAFIEAASGGAL